MTAKRIVRSVSVVFGAAALWAVPITGAQARGYHPNPPRHGPASSPGASGSQGQESKSEQASSDSNAGTPEGCFRRYDSRWEPARTRARGHREGGRQAGR